MRCRFGSVVFAALICTTIAQKQLQDLTQVLGDDPNLSQFTALLTSSAFGSLYANLSFQQDITILVPNDDAFSKIENSQIGDAFKYNQSDAIRAILQYHVIPGVHRSNSYNGSFQFNPTWLNDPKYDNVTGGQVVGGVLQSGDLNVFISGYGSRTTVSESDIAFKGGIIHTIDTFLIPPVDFTSTCSTFNLTAAGGAIANASLAPYVNTQKDITIFAPNNAAFQNLGTTLSHLTIEQLSDLLKYHVVNGSHRVSYSDSLVDGTKLQTLEGGTITITFASNSLFVNSARVLQQDILLANGVLHVLDNVLSPNASNARPAPTLRSQVPVISGTRLSHNAVPFVAYLTTGTSSSASNTAAASASANATSGLEQAAATSTSSTSATASGKKKGSAGRSRGEAVTSGFGAVIGAALWVLGIL
ncbi:hypothetical protein MMC07_004263 [Pseudocyphellaria aurata]|nr:hypothetical protein [Pseudocyphellaria aurata]